MGDLVTYVPDGPLAIITMDDGKANVLSPTMQAELHAALDRAETDTSVVVLRGREGVFSGGFDLAILRAGGTPASSMLAAASTSPSACSPFPTDHHRLHGTCRGHGRVPPAVCGLSDRRGRDLQDHGQRSGHRADHAACRHRDPAATAHPGRIHQGDSPGRGVLACRRRGLRLPRSGRGNGCTRIDGAGARTAVGPTR